MTVLEQSLISDIPRFNADEQRAMRYLFDRILVKGRANYAPFDAATETRNMREQGVEESADRIVYACFEDVMNFLAERARLECETASKVTATFDVNGGEVAEVLR